MIDILVTLCLLEAPRDCASRAVPVGAATCDEAQAAAGSRLVDWRGSYHVEDVRCGAMTEPSLDFEEVRPGIFVHRGQVALADATNRGDIANVAFIVGEEAVAVIDSGGSRALGEGVVAAVRAVTDRPIRHLILTHFHPDHVFGATALADAGALVLAHAKLPDALALRAETYLERGEDQSGVDFMGSGVARVDRVIAGTEVLDLGGRQLEIRAWPTAHTEADLTVLDRPTGTLIAGDLVFDEHLPTLDGSLSGWLGVLDEMGAIRASGVVPGHGGPIMPWPAGIALERRYLEVLARDVRALLGEGATIGVAAAAAGADEKGAWSLFDDHNPRNVTTAYTELEWE